MDKLLHWILNFVETGIWVLLSLILLAVLIGDILFPLLLELLRI